MNVHWVFVRLCFEDSRVLWYLSQMEKSSGSRIVTNYMSSSRYPQAMTRLEEEEDQTPNSACPGSSQAPILQDKRTEKRSLSFGDTATL